MNDTSTTFGNRLKALRRKQGLSQGALASRMGVTEATVRHWERDRNLPTRKRRSELASILGVTEQSLSEGSEKSTVQEFDIFREMEELSLKLLADAQIVQSTRLAMNYVQPPAIQSRFKMEQVRRMKEGSLSIEKIEILYVPGRIRDIIYNFRAYRNLNYRVRYLPTPPHPIPMPNFYAFDMTNFIFGGYHVTHPPTNSQNLWLSGEIWNRFLSEYWIALWQQSLALSELDDPMYELRSIARAIGLDDQQWQALCAEAEEIGARDIPPQP